MEIKKIGHEVLSAKVGTIVSLDNGYTHKTLVECDWWDRADLAWPDPIFADRAWACRIHITGRKLLWDGGRQKVRVKLELLGDCEPSQFASGYAWVDTMDVSVDWTDREERCPSCYRAETTLRGEHPGNSDFLAYRCNKCGEKFEVRA